MHKDLLVRYHPGRVNKAREELHFLNHLWLNFLSFRGKKELSKSSRTNRNLLFFYSTISQLLLTQCNFNSPDREQTIPRYSSSLANTELRV